MLVACAYHQHVGSAVPVHFLHGPTVGSTSCVIVGVPRNLVLRSLAYQCKALGSNWSMDFAAYAILVISALATNGCCPALTSPPVEVVVRGVLLDAETMEPLAGAAIAGATFTTGQEITRNFASDRQHISTADGSFENVHLLPRGICFPILTVPVGPRGYPVPDQIEIIVVRDGCTQSFVIEINDETVIDPTFPNDIIELAEPILVRACEQ